MEDTDFTVKGDLHGQAGRVSMHQTRVNVKSMLDRIRPMSLLDLT